MAQVPPENLQALLLLLQVQIKQAENVLGFYGQLMRELEAENHSHFANLMCMQPAMFREVFGMVSPLITKKDTRWRNVLEPGLKLVITLGHLATGDCYQ